MNGLRWLSFALLVAACCGTANADGTSYTGTLANSNDVFTATVTIGSTSDVTLQTYGFGGGANQAGTLIAPGGTDPFVGLFSGTGLGASLINGTSLDLTNYSSFVGCPPANSVSNFGGTTCGDVTMVFDALAAGTYTVLLSDGQYIPNAAIGFGTTLGDGFLDLTGGIFCNDPDFTNGIQTACPSTSGAYALDVITAPSTIVTPAPEPASLLLLASGLLGMFGIRRRSTQSNLSGDAQ